MREKTGQHVAILLCSYNGADYLAPQLQSYLDQTHADWSLHISDDGSTDGTQAMLQRFAADHPAHAVRLYSGPGEGFVRNFLNLTCRPEITADYYAYSDHDDVWFADKLARAVAALAEIAPGVPALYCSSSTLIDAQGQPCGASQCFAKVPGFGNALVQSIAGGNTMVFNHAARALLLKAGQALALPSHDWWTYQLVSGAGGSVIYDPQPSIYYRQHGCNVIGSNRGIIASLQRIRLLFAGRFRRWNSMNCEALQAVAALLTPENRVRVQVFAAARRAPFFKRLSGLARSGIYRQTALGNVGLVVAAATRRI